MTGSQVLREKCEFLDSQATKKQLGLEKNLIFKKNILQKLKHHIGS